MNTDMGSAKAMYNIGTMHRDGNGVPQDYSKSMDWFRKSAALGFNKAQFSIGMAFHKGKGVPVNEFEAMKWFKLAAESGHRKAQLMVNVLKKQINVVTIDMS